MSDEQPYRFNSSTLVLPYSNWRESIHIVRDRLDPKDREWLGEWESLDLAQSPMEDDERRFMRYGHYIGWMHARRPK